MLKAAFIARSGLLFLDAFRGVFLFAESPNRLIAIQRFSDLAI